MSANYSEALEKQAELLRFVSSERGSMFVSKALHGQTGTKATGMLVALGLGETFFVADEIEQALIGASDSLPDATLSLDLLPSRYGFLWLDEPVHIDKTIWADHVSHHSTQHRPKAGNDFAPVEEELHAISWSSCAGDEVLGALRTDTPTGIELTWFSRLQMEDGNWSQVLPSGTWAWNFGELANAAADCRDEECDTVENRPHEMWRLKFLLTTFLFMQQHVATTQESIVERHARKRLVRQGWIGEPVVRVVQLRRLEQHSGITIDGIDRQWSCRWIVSGHWRQQPYPKAGEVRPKWITPYVKGPDDKPLKPPRATVFAVVR